MDKSSRIQISLAAVFGLTAVVSGAIGAHALEETLAERGMTAAWDTAVLYHLTHSLALFALGIWSSNGQAAGSNTWAAGLWTGGIILFSGSLYILSSVEGPWFLGPVTPLGGLLLMGGWIAVLLGAWKRP